MLESLKYAAERLNDPDNLVLIFPQGALHSNFVDEVMFEKGLTRIIKQVTGKFQYVFAANFVESFQHKRPSANVYLKVAEPATDSLADINAAYQQHYAAAKSIQNQTIV